MVSKELVGSRIRQIRSRPAQDPEGRGGAFRLLLHPHLRDRARADLAHDRSAHPDRATHWTRTRATSSRSASWTRSASPARRNVPRGRCGLDLQRTRFRAGGAHARGPRRAPARLRDSCRARGGGRPAASARERGPLPGLRSKGSALCDLDDKSAAFTRGIEPALLRRGGARFALRGRSGEAARASWSSWIRRRRSPPSRRRMDRGAEAAPVAPPPRGSSGASRRPSRPAPRSWPPPRAPPARSRAIWWSGSSGRAACPAMRLKRVAELPGRLAQRRLGVEPEGTREIDHGEEQVADLLANPLLWRRGFSGCTHGLVQLAQFLLDLRQDGRRRAASRIRRRPPSPGSAAPGAARAGRAAAPAALPAERRAPARPALLRALRPPPRGARPRGRRRRGARRRRGDAGAGSSRWSGARISAKDAPPVLPAPAGPARGETRRLRSPPPARAARPAAPSP